MMIRSITSQSAWDDTALTALPFIPFTQSWEWGKILINEKEHVERLVVEDAGKPIAKALVVYRRLPLGMQYAFMPQGPVLFNPGEKAGQRAIMHEMGHYLKQKKNVFFRCEPQEAACLEQPPFRADHTIDINPPTTTVLDLAKTSTALLAAMHSKTRYNIHIAEKKGVVIRSKKNIDIFLQLSGATARRDGFRLHHAGHYRHVLDSSAATQMIAYQGTEPIATVVLFTVGPTITYLYGASDYRWRALMAPYLLQWQAILWGKSHGYRWYDFFGIAPNTKTVQSGAVEYGQENYVYDQNHQYGGVTRFKLGFGGAILERPGTYDLILDAKRYTVYQLLRRLRRLITQ